MQWLRYLSIIKYAYDTIAAIQFNSTGELQCDGSDVFYSCWYYRYYYNVTYSVDADQIKDYLNLDVLTIGENIAALFYIIIILKVATYIAMRMRK